MKKYLENYQPVAYKTFTNFKKNNIFPQAILLNGTNDIPLLDIAKYLAKIILCEQKNAPCLNCLTCNRVEKDIYPDLIIIDGKEETIKKEYFESLQTNFSKSSLEGKAKIYIINYIENATTVAVNSLLRFLEEPDENLYAILTTANINSVLPTIVSRCQNIHLKNVEKSQIVLEANKNGVPLNDCFVLSYFCGNSKIIEEKYQSENYIPLRDLTIEILNKINQDENLLYFAQIEVSDFIKNRNDFKLLLQLLEVAFFDIINIEDGTNLHFPDEKELLLNLNKKIKKINEKLETIMLYKEKADLNVNIKLLIDSLFIKLKEE